MKRTLTMTKTVMMVMTMMMKKVLKTLSMSRAQARGVEGLADMA